MQLGMSCSSVLLGLAQHRRIYSMAESPPGIKEVSSSYSSRLSHQGEWACKWGKTVIVLCLGTNTESLHIVKAVLTTARTRFFSVLSLSMLLMFCKRTVGDSTVRSLKNIHSQPDTVGYWIRSEVGSIFGSTRFCNNNNSNESCKTCTVFLNLYQLFTYSVSYPLLTRKS